MKRMKYDGQTKLLRLLDEYGWAEVIDQLHELTAMAVDSLGSEHSDPDDVREQKFAFAELSKALVLARKAGKIVDENARDLNL